MTALILAAALSAPAQPARLVPEAIPFRAQARYMLDFDVEIRPRLRRAPEARYEVNGGYEPRGYYGRPNGNGNGCAGGYGAYAEPRGYRDYPAQRDYIDFDGPRLRGRIEYERKPAPRGYDPRYRDGRDCYDYRDCPPPRDRGYYERGAPRIGVQEYRSPG